MQSIVVVNNPKDWDFHFPNIEIIAAKNYLTDSKYTKINSLRVFNLCRSHRYQSTGYYVSLLAEARGHRAFPSISTIQDLKSSTIIRTISDELDDLIQSSLKTITSDNFTLSIYFQRNVAKRYDKLAKQLYNLFQAPLLRVTFTKRQRWSIQNISAVPVNEIPEYHKKYIEAFATEYFKKKRVSVSTITKSKYDLAILIDPNEKEPPSNDKAIKKFIEAGSKLNINCEVIDREDYNSIPEYDALFIRQTTAVNNITYKFSRRAFTEGLAVIDDPSSILKCSNKVYLAELLSLARIPIPKTVIVHKDNIGTIENILGLPCVLKSPDSAFSHGVVKINDANQLKIEIEKFLETSDLIVAQKFMPTDFDWRVGILDNEPLFVCKYFMARGHWQIYNWENKTEDYLGNFETVTIKDTPDHVLSTALRAARMIGNGLYGVDVKQVKNKSMIIEINDNPNLDTGIEDKILKDKLYTIIMKSFQKRIEKIRKHGELII